MKRVREICGFTSSIPANDSAPERPDNGLTDEETVLMDRLVEFWNGFVALPDNHPNAVDEACRSLHELQRHIMARSMRRAYPDYYTQSKIKKG